jgi:hypothetical protein
LSLAIDWFGSHHGRVGEYGDCFKHQISRTYYAVDLMIRCSSVDSSLERSVYDMIVGSLVARDEGFQCDLRAPVPSRFNTRCCHLVRTVASTRDLSPVISDMQKKTVCKPKSKLIDRDPLPILTGPAALIH